MTDYRGLNWRVNFGEISEIDQFRVGYTESTSFAAYFPVGQLTDLINVLTGSLGLALTAVFKGADLQTRKLTDGVIETIYVEPRLDSGRPAQIMTIRLAEVPDLLFALNLFLADQSNSPSPDDWDNSENFLLDKETRKVKDIRLPDRLSDASLDVRFAGAADVTELNAQVDELDTDVQILGTDVDTLDTALGTLENLTSTGRLSDANVNATAKAQTKRSHGLGLTPYDPLFGAVGDGVADDTVALQAFFNYVTANDVGVAYVGGLFKVSAPLTMGAALTKKFIGRCRFILSGTGTIAITISGWDNGSWDFISIQGTSAGTNNYAGRTWQTGIRLVDGTSRSQFGKIEGAYFGFALIAAIPNPTGNITAIDFGNVRAQDCGSGARGAGAIRYGLSTTWSNVVNTGSSGSNAQASTIDVATLPPQYIIDGVYGAVGSAPYMIRITENSGKTRLHFITAIDAVNKKLTVFPWIDPATTPVSADYLYGGALYTMSSDSNVHRFSSVDAVRCGSAVVLGALYGPVGDRVISQTCGAAVVIGSSPSAANLGTRLSGLYWENNVEDVVFVCRPTSFNVYAYLTSEYAADLSKVYVVSAARVSGTFTDAPAGSGLGGVSFALKGRVQTKEKGSRNSAYSATQTLVLDRADMQVPLYGNTFTITSTLDLELHRLFGYDTIQVIAAATDGTAPTGSITFKYASPTGFTLNGGGSDVVFSGLTGPTRFLVRFDVVAMNCIVAQL